VTFVAEPGVDGIKALRSLLKTALRRFGLRAIDVRERAHHAQEDERARAQPGSKTMSAFSDRVRSQREKGLYKVADFKVGEEQTFTIDHLDEEMEMFNKTIDILNFVETGKQLQINQTNAEFLLANFGDDPEQYAGKQVTLYLAEYEFNGKRDYGIRLKLVGAPSETNKADTLARALIDGQKPKPDFDDSIPF
jgi:hypothetical protein